MGGENDILQCRVAAEFAEHSEILSGGPSKPAVGNAIDIDEPGKLRTVPISVKGLGPGGREMVNADVRLRVQDRFNICICRRIQGHP